MDNQENGLFGSLIGTIETENSIKVDPSVFWFAISVAALVITIIILNKIVKA